MKTSFPLMPRCRNCGEGHTRHLKGRACANYQPKTGLAQVSEKQEEDQTELNKMRHALLNLCHEVYGETRCEAQGKLKHECFGNLVLDHVNLKATRALKFDIRNCQILCEVANGLKGSKRNDYRSERIRKAILDRWPDGIVD